MAGDVAAQLAEPPTGAALPERSTRHDGAPAHQRGGGRHESGIESGQTRAWMRRPPTQIAWSRDGGDVHPQRQLVRQ